MAEPLDVYVKTTDNQTYKTNAGIPFECVEFVRRYFMQTHGLTFPSVVDATDMFYRVHALVATRMWGVWERGYWTTAKWI